MDSLQYCLFHTSPLADMPVQPDYRIKTYAIVNAASDEKHFHQFLKWHIPHAILYKEDDAIELETVAPYLIELDETHDHTQWLMTKQWGTHSVIYLKSHYALEPLAEHFRRYTKVIVEPRENDNRIETPAFFAFYDPRVMKHYFTVMTREQMTEFCDPVISFSYEDDDQSDHLLTSYLKKSGEQWSTLTTTLGKITVPDDDTTETTEDTLPELEDEIEVPVMPVILTIAQQEAFDERQQKRFCRRLLNDLQTHYPVSPDDSDEALYYLKEAVNNGLTSEATQSRYILTALLIKNSPLEKSKKLRNALKTTQDEPSRMKLLDQALEELTTKKEKARVG